MVKILEQKHKTLQIYETIGGYVYSEDKDELMDKIIHLVDIKPLDECCRYAKENNYTAIIGNFKAQEIYSILKNLYEEIEMICVLRNPLDRIYSEYCHNTFHQVFNDTFENFCKLNYNTMYRIIGEDLSIFTHVIDFPDFQTYIEKLGYYVEHENKSEDKKILKRDDDTALIYNKLDIYLYNKFKTQ